MSSSANKYLLFGVASPYVFEVIESAKRAHIEIAGFIHNQPHIEVPEGLSPVFNLEQLDSFNRGIPVIIPLITPGYRKKVETQVYKLGFKTFGNLIDPTAIMATSSQWQEGFQVNAGVVIGANCTFGRQVQVNRSTSIGHDVTTGDFVSFGPASVICGTCKIGAGTFIGAAAVVLPEVTIGKNCIIGAGSVVTADVPDYTLVVGNPAKVVKTKIKGYNDVSV